MKRNAIYATIIVSLLATLSASTLAATQTTKATQQPVSTGGKVNNTNKSPSLPTQTSSGSVAVGGATVQNSSGSSDMPPLPKILQMKMALQNSPLSQNYQVGQISLSIPDLYSQSDDAIVFIDNAQHNFYYSLDEMVHLSNGKISKESDGDIKYIFSDTATITINAAHTQAIVFVNNQESKISLSASNFLDFQNSEYATEAILGKLFNVSSSLSSLEASFYPIFTGMKQENALHEMALQGYQKNLQTKDDSVDLNVKPAMIGLGRVQLYYNAVSKSTGSLNYNYDAPLLGGTFVSSGTTGTQPFFTTAYLQYNLAGNNIFAGGKNIYTSQYTYTPIFGNFNGIYYGKANITNVGYGTIDVSGQANNGDRVELYRSGVLLAFQYAQSGRYDFIDVKLASPRDVFTIKVYNPDNTYSEYTTSVYSGLGFLKEGESSVTASLGQTYYNTTNSPAHSLEYTYGVTSDLTASVSQSQGPLNTGVSTSLYYKNTAIVPNYTIGQYSYFNDNLSRASINQYLLFTNNFQMNYGYLYSNLFDTNAANTTFYFQNGSQNYSLNFVGNYVGAQNYAETFSLGQPLGSAYNTASVGVTQQLGGQNGSTVGDQLSLLLLSNINFIGGVTYYSTTQTTAENLQLLYTDPNYSCSVQYTQDNQHNQVTTASISIPMGLGFLDTLSASASSNATQSVGAGKNIILAHPLQSANGMVTNGWVYGHISNADGTPYQGGKISIGGQAVTINSSGNYFASNVSANTRQRVDLSSLSTNNHYGVENSTMYIKVPAAQGVQMNFTLSELRNIFGMIQGPSDELKGVQVQLLEDGKVVKTSSLDYSGTYAFNNVAGTNYTIHIIVPQGYTISQNDMSIQFTKDSDWLSIQNPIVIQKEV